MTQAIADPRQASAALAELFDTHKRVVFFGGAGVSTASGIPDFRSAAEACLGSDIACVI